MYFYSLTSNKLSITIIKFIALRLILLSVIIVTDTTNLSSKSINIDSLKQVLQTCNQVEDKLKIYNRLTELYLRSNLDSADYFNLKAIKFAQEVGDEKLLRKASCYQVKVKNNMRKLAEAERLADMLIPKCIAANDTFYILFLFNQKYVSKYWAKDHDSTLYFLEQGLRFSQNYPKSEAHIYGNMAIEYKEKNDIPKAIELFFKSLEKSKETEDTYAISIVYSNIGVTYTDQYQYEKAATYYEKSIELAEEIGDLAGLAWLHGVIGDCYEKLQQYKKAIQSYRKAIQIAEEVRDVHTVFNNKSVLAHHYLEYHRNDSTFQFALQLIDEVEGMDIDIEEVSNYHYYLTKAIISNHYGRKKAAVDYAEKAYQSASKGNHTGPQILVSDQLSGFYQKIGDYQKAFKYHVIFKTLSDSLANDKNLAAIEIQTAEYQFQLEKAEQDKKLASTKNTLRLRTFAIIAALLFLLLVSFIAIILRRANVQKAKQNELLERKVDERTKELQQANYELRTFSYIASHDIKEPIRVIGGYAGLIFKKLPDNLKENLGEYFDTIKRSTMQLYTLIEDFTRYTTLSKDEKIETTTVSLSQLTSNVIDSLQETIKKHKGKVIVSELPTIQSSNSLLFTILKNLIENGLKYNQSETPTVNIRYEKATSSHKIIVSDNGIGIEEIYHKKIFEMFKRLHNRGDYEGSGIGLAIVKLGSDKLNGIVDIESTVGQGTTFTLQLPYD